MILIRIVGENKWTDISELRIKYPIYLYSLYILFVCKKYSSLYFDVDQFFEERVFGVASTATATTADRCLSQVLIGHFFKTFGIFIHIIYIYWNIFSYGRIVFYMDIVLQYCLTDGISFTCWNIFKDQNTPFKFSNLS